MADETNNNECTYCDHHIWSDHQGHHICIVDGGENGKHEETACGAKCKLDPKRFKRTKRFRNEK